MREQGRTRWAKANTLHHREQGKHSYAHNTSKPRHCMPSHICTPQKIHTTHREKNTHLHTHALTYSYRIILLYPAFSISPMCCLSHPSYLKSLLHSLYHPIIFSSLFPSFTPLNSLPDPLLLRSLALSPS